MALDTRNDEAAIEELATVDAPAALERPPIAPPAPAAPQTLPQRTIDYDNEERFHDEWGKAIDPSTVPVIASFEACTAPENAHIMRWLGDVRGLRVLDLGCGAGEAATYFALRGAEVTATDLSSGMLEVTRRVAYRHGVQVRCVQARGEQLAFPDGAFDIVYTANLLHHVDLSRTLPEICRVLRPDGRFVSWDPLRHNPLINIYRRIASAVRTEDETPLSIHDVDAFRDYFGDVEHRCFWLASLWIFVRFFVIERVHPSKERYWKKIILEADRLARSYTRLSRIDNWLLRRIPWLQRMCWNVVICARNPHSTLPNPAASHPSTTTNKRSDNPAPACER